MDESTHEQPSVEIDVVRVFSDADGRFGNPLGLVWATPAVRGHEGTVAHRLGFSETAFVEDVRESGASSGETGKSARGDTERSIADVRIFTPASELPFAGHPCVGTAWWLAELGTPVGALRVPAGDVRIRTDADLVWVRARPEWSPAFEWLQLSSADEVDALDATRFTDGQTYAWAWLDEGAGLLRSRMFAPTLGVPEDEATGSAATGISAILGRDLTILQGAGSELRTHIVDDGYVEVGGRVVAAPSRTLIL